MRKKRVNSGFTLIELVLVITLIGIIGVPITQSVVQAIKTNIRSKQVLDATILAGKLAEAIQVGGPTAAGLTPDGVPVNTDANNSTYSVACSPPMSAAIDTGSYAMAGYGDYYLLTFTSTQIQIAKYTKDASGATIEDTSYSSTPENFAADSCSLVVSDSELKVYPYESLTGTSLSFYGKPVGGVNEIIKNIRVINARSSTPINLKLYNNLTPISGTEQVVNVFYNSSLNPFAFYIQYDKNIVLRDLKNTTNSSFGNTLTFNTKLNKLIYTITIKKNASDADALVTRQAVWIRK